jgi:hypothetical protein
MAEMIICDNLFYKNEFCCPEQISFVYVNFLGDWDKARSAAKGYVKNNRISGLVFPCNDASIFVLGVAGTAINQMNFLCTIINQGSALFGSSAAD